MIRGACPSLFAPMATGDGLLVRVKPPGSVLTTAQAKLLADAAARWGNGVIEATSRASLQLRGLAAEAVGPFAAAMVAAGLGDADPAVEMRRNIIATPLAGVDPTASPHAGPVASALAALLAVDARLGALPAKFGFLVDGGGALGLAGVAADVCVRLDDAGCWLALDGGTLAACVNAADAAAGAVRLAHAFLALAGSRRMRALVGEVGEAAIFAAAGLSAHHLPLPVAEEGRGEGGPRVGRLTTLTQPSPASGRGLQSAVFGVGLPFGTVLAGDLHALAALADEYGDGVLRLTPWRVLVIVGVRDPAALRMALDALNLIADPADPRLRIAACPGRPACASATVDTRTIATLLAQLRPSRPIHVSGCSKGCAHAGPSAITFVGRDGAYDLVRDGRAADGPVAFGLTEAQVLAQTMPA